MGALEWGTARRPQALAGPTARRDPDAAEHDARPGAIDRLVVGQEGVVPQQVGAVDQQLGRADDHALGALRVDGEEAPAHLAHRHQFHDLRG